MTEIKIKNFLDDVKIGADAKDFWTRIAGKLSPEEIEAFIILKKELRLFNCRNCWRDSRTEGPLSFKI